MSCEPSQGQNSLELGIALLIDSGKIFIDSGKDVIELGKIFIVKQ